MKTTNTLFTIGLMSLWLVGCATRGQLQSRADDCNKVVRMHEVLPGKTTKTMLLEWFGPPTAELYDSEKDARLTWRFSVPACPDMGACSATLVARVGTDGKVTWTSSSYVGR